ncbi:unnamed protein product [Rangifer tarandus platyrhynchus]|uniref:Secreted protein n=1 Tax=Rangifer tarandus platyrhynchus TaxID=3082113 RepID=A0ABN8YJF8_RANTA|nr:unnamed protein product [Rangifer tarandus platyrhynchus]
MPGVSTHTWSLVASLSAWPALASPGPRSPGGGLLSALVLDCQAAAEGTGQSNQEHGAPPARRPAVAWAGALGPRALRPHQCDRAPGSPSRPATGRTRGSPGGSRA